MVAGCDPSKCSRVVRVAVGVGFLGAAAYNVLVTRRDAERVLARMGDDAWLPPWRSALRRFAIPHATAVTMGAAALEATAGACILAGGRVATTGLVTGAAWAVVTTPLLPPRQAAGNFAIAPALLALAACTRSACPCNCAVSH
jgi:hypothetical protein